MKTVKITAAFALLLESNSWVIIDNNSAVGAYKSRTLAREAKAEGLVGSVKNVSEVEFEVVASAKPNALDLLAAMEKREAAKAVNLNDFATNEAGNSCCPVCGSEELYQGRIDPKDLNSGMGRVIDEDSVGGCHHCDWEFDHSAKKSRTPITHVSTIENPCKTVWGIAIDMKAANPLVKRGAVLAECVRQGIAYYTARTQYQAWLSICKEEEATRLANEAKSK